MNVTGNHLRKLILKIILRFCQNSSFMHDFVKILHHVESIEVSYRRNAELSGSGAKPVILLQIDSRFGLAARAPKFNYYYYYYSYYYSPRVTQDARKQ